MLTKAPMDKIESLNDWLGENELRGLWQGKAALYREPDPFGAARLWKWDTLRSGLEAATELIPTDFRDTRRAIHLTHPSLNGRGDQHPGHGCAVGEGGRVGVCAPAYAGGDAICDRGQP